MKTLPAEMKTAASGYAHMGTFAARKVAEGAVYGMNAQGTAFEDASTQATVMPFRTYMAKTQTAAQTRSANPSVIHIAETTGIDRIEPEVNGNEEDSESGDYLIIRSIGSSRVGRKHLQYPAQGLRLYRSVLPHPRCSARHRHLQRFPSWPLHLRKG